ncbi:MAG: carbohydrate porin [Gammaproteobacteria bacterium]|nr:carbohydrate porin [Gammaproteobacteria bacterium]
MPDNGPRRGAADRAGTWPGTRFLAALALAWSGAAAAAPAARVDVQYIGEALRTVSGGLARGDVYDGNLYLEGDLRTGAAGWWAGGHVHAAFLNIISGQPSPTLIGDEQGASNIAAANRTDLYSFWYRQRLDHGRIAMLAGLRAINGSFAYSSYADAFVNSSFGIVPTVSLNAPSSIWPQLGLGAQISYRPDRQWRVLTGLFQGDPAQREAPFGAGAMSITEVDWQRAGVYRGTYKVGFWYDRAHRAPVLADTASSADAGFYMDADQVIWHGRGRRRLGAFVQLSNALGRNNLVNRYAGIGLLALGWFPRHPGSAIGLAIASAHNSPWARQALGIPAAETAFELTGLFTVNRMLTVQPDLQYIEGPSAQARVPDALVAILRVTLNFGGAA